MIALTLAALFTVVAMATVLTLIDFALRASSGYAALKRQNALIDAGFVPQVEASVVRLRPVVRRADGTTRPFARRLPQVRSLPALDVA